MENGIKLLIDKEQEAKNQVEKMLEYKETIKMKAKEDAGIALLMIKEEHQNEYNKKLEEIDKYLEDYKNEKDEEFNQAKIMLDSLNYEEIVKKLASIVTGNVEH